MASTCFLAWVDGLWPRADLFLVLFSRSSIYLVTLCSLLSAESHLSTSFTSMALDLFTFELFTTIFSDIPYFLRSDLIFSSSSSFCLSSSSLALTLALFYVHGEWGLPYFMPYYSTERASLWLLLPDMKDFSLFLEWLPSV